MRSLLLCTFAVAAAFAASADQTPSVPTHPKAVSPTAATTPTATPGVAPKDLTGLWEAKLRFGPDVRGTLLVRGSDRRLSAEIAGYSTEIKTAGDAVAFELLDEKNAFRGNFTENRSRIVGHWIQPSGYASPVTLTRAGNGDEWRGVVSPYDETFTLYLATKIRDDGSLGAFLRNPERNMGANQYPIDRMEIDGQTIKLLAAANANEPGRTLARGKYDAETKVLSIVIPNRGGTFDFKRVPPDAATDFYARGRLPGPKYSYTPPPAFEDGWPIASVEDVGISREGVEKFIQMIVDTPIDSIHAPEIHGIAIARHGKLVLEEYFHGEHRDKPHDLRSAGKSLTSTLIGAAIKAGLPVKVTDRVYQVMNDGQFPQKLEAGKREMTLENLLTMSSGLDCDDEEDSSPGNEEKMLDLEGKPDFYKFTMDLKMVRKPGEKAAYCSGGANLAGGVLARATGRSLLNLTDDLIAKPLQIKQYYMPLTPTGDAYMGGGLRLRLRDFAKLAQLYLNQGQWNGHQILTAEWCRRATSSLYKFSETSKASYGYLWWVYDYPYRGRTVRAYFASGLGWQYAIAIPELDLVIGLYAGNYSDELPLHKEYIPKWILPAVEDDR
jgi:CubicO group peptidase (beta-lactamase class C family)